MQKMVKEKVWRVKEENPVLQQILSRKLGISPLLSRLLVNRGVLTVEDARLFLKGNLNQAGDPYLLPDMHRAVEIILAAIKNRKNILVYGDYDADGVTATALMVKVLERLGARVDYYIPHRLTQGYGLHEGALQWARQAGMDLLVTVDCGISSKKEVEAAKRAGGPEIIITDHHQVPEEIPPALAVINPQRRDSSYPFKELAGVGVALKLAQALLQAAGEGETAWHDYLDLACVGTVADIVPLTGENRLLVKHGLPKLAATANPGLQALMQVSGVKAEKIGTREVGFALAPRLNAAGRMGDSRMAVELLLCRDPVRAGELAAQLDRENRERQQVESRVLAEALGMLDALGRTRDLVVVLASPGWHPGVIGIVASKLVEILYRPVLLVSLDGGQGKGSGRSIPGFHLYQALSSCREHLLAFGGHEGAAGFTITADRVDALREALNDYAAAVMSPDLLRPGLEIDALVSLEDIPCEVVAELESLSPHGHGNPEPLLACCGVAVINCREVGRDGRHLKLLVRENGTVRDSIGFDLVGYLENLAPGEAVDLAFVPSLDQWNGNVRVQLEIRDLRRAGEWEGAPPLQEPGIAPDRGMDDFLVALHTEAEKSPVRSPYFFWPEFIQRKLAEYEQKGSGSLAAVLQIPGGLNHHAAIPLECSAFPPVACSAEGAPDTLQLTAELPFRIEDLRGQFARPSWLAGLADARQCLLVVVGSAHRTVELAFYLRRVCSGPGRQVAFCHPWLSSRRRELLRQLFARGEINVLLTTPALAPALAGAGTGHLVIYNLPYHREEWDLLLAAALAGEVQSLWLPFGAEDMQEARFYLAALAPDRDPLARLYTLLHRAARENSARPHGREAGSVETGGDGFSRRLAGLLRRGGCPWVQDFTVALGLKVFSELGLVEWSPPGSGWPVSLRPAGGQKLSLEASPTYRRLHQLKKEALAWQKHALEAPVREIVAGSLTERRR
ncbi:single-stranded-DNA-specific exonuclease RecJ [Desulfofundulus kuznetsovii DSM 6115]|uniref:Single-stranded-DNA-specific exonuclease RecJ n=2 Tax=Desulfofundulus kuznetsovii TaxID=58135 RepID=A0AAU8PUC1_DESK7|nr:single-stranded-DNA-specific exonuclease RecJ [Desulfofundulus kuznetsovii DSM 6115]